MREQERRALSLLLAVVVILVNVLSGGGVMSVKATSESSVTEEGSFTIYFAVPEEWTNNNYTIKANARKTTDQQNDWIQKDMADTGETYEGKKVYEVSFSTQPASVLTTDCPYGGFATLQFQAYEGTAYKTQQTVFENKWTGTEVFSGKLYNGSGWVEYSPTDSNDHTVFAGKTMYFENRGTHEITGDVIAVFYEKDESGSLKEIQRITMTKVTDGKRYEVQIPSETCSYVRFEDGTGAVLGAAYSNFYGQGEGEADTISFLYDESEMFCYRYYEGAEDSYWGTLGGTTVYYDAALSKMSYAGSSTNAGGNGIPYPNKPVYYYAAGDGKEAVHGSMTLAEQGNYKDVYKVDIPEGYTKIRFAGWEVTNTADAQNGDGTKMLEIPTNLGKPCFYGDNSDSVIYDGGNRDGYWDEAYSLRNAEAKKENKDVVDIGSGTFTKESGILYVNSTFYDYYSDYELNGNNRDTYDGSNGVSQRNWVTFRQFDQALSDYYNGNATIPIYTGHFQPKWSNWGTVFSDISDTLNLYGYDKNDQTPFMSSNNSTMDINGAGDKYACAAQGLVSDTLSGGVLMASGGNIQQPHFNEAFLTGSNSKNTVLGEVYHNVAFPFTKKDIHNDGVQYWCFDSAETTLAMKQDSSSGQYYLKNVGNQGWSQNVNSTGTTSGDSVSNKYGFFPFNETSSATSGKNYNYGFGTRLDITFRLTEDGTVLSDKEDVPITFDFSGDDDVWVFIDGKLALDVGGAHGRAEGSLNFATKKATVKPVKASAGSSAAGESVVTDFTIDGSNTDEHTLTMFYMERGMWESNMKITFNFPDENQLEVEKQVDKTEVNDLFKDLFDDVSLFPFTIKNLATHYGTKAVEGGTVEPETFNNSFTDTQLTPTPGNTFEHVTEKSGQSDVAKWHANMEDKTGAYREQRYGTFTSGNGTSVDISEMKYLEFKYYYDYNDTPSLSNMYLQLVDTNGKVKGNVTDYLSGKTYGAVTMAGKKWVTVKLDLEKLTAQDGFNNQVQSIRFGYNYPRTIYLDDFIFHPSAEAQGTTGFLQKQYDIPDYGSAESGKLEIPKGAVYTSSKGGAYTIGEDGTFVLKDKEVVTFRDQFRRGSYIALEENVNSELFDTKWTMYEDGKAVISMGSGENVTNGSKTELVDESGVTVDDGRTEAYLTGTADGQQLENAYKGTKPEESTFVFRSYANPDDTSTMAKLKVVFYNKVKTGSLAIKKDRAFETDNLDGTYTFEIIFTNVGGLGLENEAIHKTVTLKYGEEVTIDGIPLGTFFQITEKTPEDGSSLNSVEVEKTMTVDPETKVVTGTITEELAKAKVIYKNTKKPVISVSLEKKWIDMDGENLTAGLPESIRVRLERKAEDETDSKYQVVEGYENIVLTPGYEGWRYQIEGLDQKVDYTDPDSKNYVYRFVELDDEGKPVADRTFFKNYFVTYGDTVTDETTGDISTVITNTLFDKTNIKIIKRDASDDTKLLPNVEFKLEKLDENGNVDTTFTALTGKTDENGVLRFNNVRDGTYRLTEIKAADGYSLLKDPITIVLDRKNGCTVDGENCTVDDQNTITLTIQNRHKFELPATGGYWRTYMILGGLALAGAALFMYRLQLRRTGDRKGSRRK